MRSLLALAIATTLLGVGAAEPREYPLGGSNANIDRAGILRAGVLTIALEAKRTTWLMDGARLRHDDDRRLSRRSKRRDLAMPSDSLIVRWRPVAKDGADLPAAAAGGQMLVRVPSRVLAP
jgi:hypothetical protein